MGDAIEPDATGFLVTDQYGRCPRCGDQNSDGVICLTCTNPTDLSSQAYWTGVLELLRSRSKRLAELERQRDAVLALHQPVPSGYRWIGSMDNPANRVPHNECSSCYSPGSFDDYDTACRDTWPCPTAAIYGGGE